jgi:hypothetical protein
VSAHPDPDEKQASAVADASRDLLVPWYADSVHNDRERIARWQASVHGAPAPAAPSGALTYYDVAPATLTDARVWRKFTRVAMTLDPPQSLYADDEVRRKAAEARAGHGALPAPGPGRDEFLRAVTTAADH